MLTLVGHKFGAPKGVAALFVRRGLALPPMVRGGGQEAGRRAGTENVLLISGMGKAAEVSAGGGVRVVSAEISWLGEACRQQQLSLTFASSSREIRG